MVARTAASVAGFHVLEFNTSEKRSGKALLEVLASASTTHTLKGDLNTGT